MTRFSSLKLSEIKIIFVQVRCLASVLAHFLTFRYFEAISSSQVEKRGERDLALSKNYAKGAKSCRAGRDLLRPNRQKTEI